jgi:hypothetical protein
MKQYPPSIARRLRRCTIMRIECIDGHIAMFQDARRDEMEKLEKLEGMV